MSSPDLEPMPEPNEPLIDVTDIDLIELVETDHTVLANSLRRVLDDVERSGEAISGWSSYVN